MKRMTKSVRQEVAWLLPTPKRLKMLEKKSLEKLRDACYVYNECQELLEEQKKLNGYDAVNGAMIIDDLKYITKYANSVIRMHGELAESCKGISELFKGNPNTYKCPLLLKMRIKKVVYVAELLANVATEMCKQHDELREAFETLLDEKMTEIELREGE